MRVRFSADPPRAHYIISNATARRSSDAATAAQRRRRVQLAARRSRGALHCWATRPRRTGHPARLTSSRALHTRCHAPSSSTHLGHDIASTRADARPETRVVRTGHSGAVTASPLHLRARTVNDHVEHHLVGGGAREHRAVGTPHAPSSPRLARAAWRASSSDVAQCGPRQPTSHAHTPPGPHSPWPEQPTGHSSSLVEQSTEADQPRGQ